MEKKPPPTTLIELTIEALESRQKRWDWEWIICFHIRQWETRNAAHYEKARRPLLHGHFAWYHWHEICDRVLARAVRALQRRKDDLLKPGNQQGQWAFSRKICTDMVYPECEVEFTGLVRALGEHGLDVYAE